jgi:hypothetical protein
VIGGSQLQLNRSARQQSERRFNQHPVRRDIDDQRFVAGPNARLNHAMFGGVKSAPRAAPLCYKSDTDIH